MLLDSLSIPIYSTESLHTAMCSGCRGGGLAAVLKSPIPYFRQWPDLCQSENGFFRPFEHIFWFKFLIFGRSLPTPNFTGFRLKKHACRAMFASDAETFLAKWFVLVVQLFKARKVAQTVFGWPDGSKVTKPLLSLFLNRISVYSNN